MTGLIVIRGLLICTIVLQLIWIFVSNGHETDNPPQTWSEKRRRPDDIRGKYIYGTPACTIMDESDTPYDSDEMPSYSCPSPIALFLTDKGTRKWKDGREIWTYGDERKVCDIGKTEKEKPERDFGQAKEDLYRRAYPGNPEIVEENSIKAFLDKCAQSEDFRLAFKRTRHNTLQEAVINSMQDECLRVGEKDLAGKHFKPIQRSIFEVEDGDRDEDVTVEAEGTQRENVDRNNVPDNFSQNSGKGSQG
ncbi:unnamed protein product [Mytilus edulis]|uniref:Uncharacterized protein n=1 Tax=Mytilus edulis TaxID=6550 RepID=A0A8S3TE84_MYTED|nr:unnamed protein product [Mytilus edulis]